MTDLFDFAVCDDFLINRFCDLLSWLAACDTFDFFGGCWLLLLFVVSGLDEDCNPGWGDCGRPLRRW